MAKAVATCKCRFCGNTFEKVSVKRNTREAEEWKVWAARTFDICPACEDKQQEEKVARLAEEAKASGLPELTGSPKQIAWAEQIRAAQMKKIDAYLEQAKVACDAETLTRIENVLSYILQHKANAGWWIDNRNNSPAILIRNNFREAEEAGNK